MAIDSRTALSRRALIAGALGALGATAASALAGPLAATATADSLVLVNDETDANVFQASSWFGGDGVRGVSNSGVGVRGLSETGTAVHGAGTAGIGVLGSSVTVGVRGESDQGRGGVFQGGKAQVRLLPSGASSHPNRGQRGDLFLDKSGRLWFCKGGTNWKRVA